MRQNEHEIDSCQLTSDRDGLELLIVITVCNSNWMLDVCGLTYNFICATNLLWRRPKYLKVEDV